VGEEAKQGQRQERRHLEAAEHRAERALAIWSQTRASFDKQQEASPPKEILGQVA
jgi:hypothetical protein